MVRRHKCHGILPCWVLLHYGVPHLCRTLKIGSLDSLTLLFLANFANGTSWSEDSSYGSFFFSFSHLRLLHFGLHLLSKNRESLVFYYLRI